jgi:predicted acyltransferase
MILVNNPGSWAHIHAPLRHAAWHGWTPTDLVFPFFLFAVGVAIALAFARRRGQGAGRSELLRKIARRTVLIFGLGLLLNGFPYTDPGHWRVWGVLQRIALCYGIAGVTIVLVRGDRGRLAVALGLCAAYELLMRLPLVADWGGGSFDFADNFARWLDLQWPGPAHLYRVGGEPFDPEGLVTTLPAAAGTIGGYFVGRLMQDSRPLAARLGRLALWGAALALCGGMLGRTLEPINKQLWTVSYTILTGGLACLGLAVCAWMIDIRGWRRGLDQAIIFGSNALVAFVGSGLGARVLDVVRVPGGDGGDVALKTFIYRQICAPWAGPVNGSLVFAVATVGLWWLALRELHKRSILIRI